jgi:hypothetical protein
MDAHRVQHGQVVVGSGSGSQGLVLLHPALKKATWSFRAVAVSSSKCLLRQPAARGRPSILEADDDLELLERVKEDRKKRLQKQRRPSRRMQRQRLRRSRAATPGSQGQETHVVVQSVCRIEQKMPPPTAGSAWLSILEADDDLELLERSAAKAGAHQN